MRWIVSQIGARQHYGVPRGFHYNGNFRLLYTDVWCRWGHSFLRHGPSGLRALAGRYHSDLPSNRVESFNWPFVLEAGERRVNATVTDSYLHHLNFGAAFAKRVNRGLAKQQLDPNEDFFFGFNTGCLETLNLLRERGFRTVVDQIDPARTEEEIVLAEVERWPGWQTTPGKIPEAYFERLSAEWEAATIVLVNSEWSKKALVAQSVPPQKLLVVPVAFEPSDISASRRPNLEGPMTVLWLGTVNLRKGIPYLVEAARKLESSNIRFVVAGSIAISKQALASAPSNISFVGRVTRDQAVRWYRAADVFVLPTVSDGFAITQIEAMAQGLPVITTPNCGEVVTHGIDGVIVPPRDSDALANALLILDSNRELLREMSYQAKSKATTFHLPRQAEEIERAMTRVIRGKPISSSMTPVEGLGEK